MVSLERDGLGKRLQKLRREKGLSAGQVAEAAQITEGFLRKIESGAKEPSLETFIILCNILSANVDEILLPLLKIDRIHNGNELKNKIENDELNEKQIKTILEILDILSS